MSWFYPFKFQTWKTVFAFAADTCVTAGFANGLEGLESVLLFFLSLLQLQLLALLG